jgi:hypothetical protein
MNTAVLWLTLFSHNHDTEVFNMNLIIYTVTPCGTDHPITLDLHAIVHVLKQVPDQRKRRGVRYL